jgi:hypothetical protein
MKKATSGWIAAIVMLASFHSGGSLLAHHSLAEFDTTTAVTVKGAIVLIQRVNPHEFVFVEQQTNNGGTERWAVEGPSTNTLSRRGLERKFKVGDVVEACGYVMKESLEHPHTVWTGAKLTGRILTAETMVMPDGIKVRWNDYGFHRCPPVDDGHQHVSPPR